MHGYVYLSCRQHCAIEHSFARERGWSHTDEAWEEELILSQVNKFCV